MPISPTQPPQNPVTVYVSQPAPGSVTYTMSNGHVLSSGTTGALAPVIAALIAIPIDLSTLIIFNWYSGSRQSAQLFDLKAEAGL